MTESDVSLDSGGVRLRGTLCRPDAAEAPPAVLFVHGSGPMDRDENMPGQRLEVFNTFAHALAAAGFASIRYDKRGCGASSGDYFITGYSDLVDDAARWLDALVRGSYGRFGPVFLLGHSEGCLIAAQAGAAQAATAGMVLLCPFIERIEAVLLRQAARLEHEIRIAPGWNGVFLRLLSSVGGRPTASQRRLIGRLRTDARPTFRERFQRVPARWLRELMDQDPRAVYSQVRVPILAISGGKDLQCDPADSRRIAEVIKGPATVGHIENLTHVLRCDESPPMMLRSGQLLRQPVEPAVLAYVLEWLSSQCPATGAR
jgi:uncharacterized protein